ncbi:MAG: MBL fold metallo-hydrolase [Desulfobacterales bacterium]|nr:MBL fold metallo-hydrolase [Desulfobacterales bacterium]
MKIFNLSENCKTYTSNVYFVLGTWKAIADMNTLVDVGRDPSIIEKINQTSTGVGKKKVDQVVLTHSHYDHSSLLPRIKELFNPVVYAFSESLAGVDHILKDGEKIRMGDRIFEVIHMPGHSNDSICLYNNQEGVLFSGDAPLIIRSSEGTHEEGFIKSLAKLCRRNITSIYCGHGEPILEDAKELLRATLKIVSKN